MQTVKVRLVSMLDLDCFTRRLRFLIDEVNVMSASELWLLNEQGCICRGGGLNPAKISDPPLLLLKTETNSGRS